MTPSNRREFLALTGTAAATFAVGAAVTSPALVNPLVTEGRRLVAAYRDAYTALEAIYGEYNRTVPDDAPTSVHRRWERFCGTASGRAIDAYRALTAFVVRVNGRTSRPLTGNVWDMNTCPASVVELDGTLWMAVQDPNGKPGDLILGHAVVGDVVRL